MRNSGPAQNSSPLTQVPTNDTTRAGCLTAQHIMTGSLPSISNEGQISEASFTETIRLNCVWDKTLISVNIDLHANGETFFNTIQATFRKRKKTLDRSVHSILFKIEKASPDTDGCSLSFDEANLSMDWDSTLEWMNENRREKPPHLFGKVECDTE